MILILVFSVLGIYGLVIIILTIGFYKVPRFYLEQYPTPQTAFSIVVPFRNEKHNLPVLLQTIAKLNYPNVLFEVLLIDDDSDEKFEIEPEYSFAISILSNQRKSKSPKKDAINTAIKNAKNEWIITTDADCQVPKNWLLILDQFIQKNEVQMIAGAVTYTEKKSFLSQFQQLDLMSLQGATIGSFGLHQGFMCNGANFAYTKSFFEDLNGFEGYEQFASGDDVFLLQKALQIFPEKVGYLKSIQAVVKTAPENSWKSLFQQRVRWAAKTAKYPNVFGKVLGILVFLTNVTAIATLVFGAFQLLSFIEIEIFWIIKMIIDFMLLFATNRFLGRKKMPYWLLGSLVYPFFSVTVATYSLFGTFEWKGRKAKY
ncbi:glycosyltransferase family 2 protein [Flavobacterium agrisoli]|uniref:Glycosyltransferase n=1 Tax=Flavobacterium agrisoli TaxID=2793066 RepID=A0A934PLV4_9FLAO|nr:glycosyltransferase [Flavobacterium agrisoli]MBK0370556.1 glycosyltransferase [Flavobacterium agrisoli]